MFVPSLWNRLWNTPFNVVFLAPLRFAWGSDQALAIFLISFTFFPNVVSFTFIGYERLPMFLGLFQSTRGWFAKQLGLILKLGPTIPILIILYLSINIKLSNAESNARTQSICIRVFSSFRKE